MDLKGKDRGSVKDTMPSSKNAPLAPITSDTDTERRHALPHDSRSGPVVVVDDDAHADDENDETEAQDSAGSMTAQSANPIHGKAGTASVPSLVRRPTEASQTDREEAQVFEVVRRDLLLGP